MAAHHPQRSFGSKPILLIKAGRLWLRAARKNARATCQKLCAKVTRASARSTIVAAEQGGEHSGEQFELLAGASAEAAALDVR